MFKKVYSVNVQFMNYSIELHFYFSFFFYLTGLKLNRITVTSVIC